MLKFIKNLFKIDKSEINTFNKIPQIIPCTPKGIQDVFINLK